SSAEEWSSLRREAVLLHELAHVARHDCLTQTLAAVACALYWPHPLAWLAAARLRVDRELACDDAVLTRGIFARDYARDLLELARALSMPVPRLAVSMAGVRELEGRLRSLIDGARSRRAPSRAMTSVAIVGACVAGLLAAIVRPAPVAAAAAPVQALAVASRPAPTASPSRFGGQFAIRLTTPADGPENQGRVHVMLWTPGINTFYSEMRELAGLTREQLLTDGATLKFSLHRDAGALEFSGVARHATAQGQFSFEADTSFNRALADRGIAAITPEDQFSFARHNLSLAFLDELARLGYPTPTRRELVVVATSGADLKYLREMSALGYRASSLSGLVALSNQGVDPAFVRRLSAIGYRSLPVADLLQLRNEDVDSTFIADANARAGRRLSVGELILLRMNRSESEPPAAEPIADDTVTTGRWMLHTLPGGTLQLDIEWANVNQWRRLLRASDITELDQGRFRLAQDAGVFTFERGGDFSFAPNKGFLATLRSLGVRDADRIGIHQLKNLAFGFMSADSVKEIMGEGLAPLTLHDVVDLAVYQITPGFVRQVKASGYEDLTLRRVVDIKMGARVPKVVGGER
ncbi:MAG TPA: M56 family metallopeptidase, partial [Gemmatimonadaceae bacterium]|nr:M56 family metallopeptidase [Gemmatimonadaceae bacterium]